MRSFGFLAVLVLASVFSCSSQEGQDSKQSGSKPTASGAGASSIAGSAAVSGAASGGADTSAAGTAGAGAATSGAAGSSSGAGGGGMAGAGGSGGGTVLPFGHRDPTVKHPTYDGFTLWLVEDFTQPLDLAKDPVWTWSDGGFQTHRFTRDAIGFQDGKMVLTLSDEAVPPSCSFFEHRPGSATSAQSGRAAQQAQLVSLWALRDAHQGADGEAQRRRDQRQLYRFALHVSPARLPRVARD